MVRIGRLHHITSIADMISSRYGKSGSLAALTTVIAVIVITPYIALQLKAVTISFHVISNSGADMLSGFPQDRPDFSTAFWIAAGMAFFTILFGTRNIDANERHHGVVAAIAVEAVVKLVALLAVGLLVVFGMGLGTDEMFGGATPPTLHNPDIFGASWITQTFLAAVAVICLPRQFQMTVVECTNEQHLRTASWMFPLYMLLICVFVMPIAIAGLNHLPEGSNPDMFVLTLPMWADQNLLALLAFLGGFSSATSMVIVSAIALSTMLSNHIIMPIALRLPGVSPDANGDIRRFLLNSRRISIVLILLLGFLNFRLSPQSDALASIGLISFVGVAQFLPALVGGLFWRQANARGAMAGMIAGFAVWAYTLFLPSFKGAFILTESDISFGLWQQALLRPQALFGLEGLDPLVHATFWSMAINITLFVLISLSRAQKPLERLQGTLFVDVFRAPAADTSRVVNRSATRHDLNAVAQRVLGPDETLELFQKAERRHGLVRDNSLADDAFISELERKLAGSVGAASARAMISQVVIGETISLHELMKIADEAQRIRDYSHQLEEKSRQLEATAGQLKDANDQLTLLDSQKDDFLSQVSHEVRTPMTSIRSFSEILLDADDLRAEQSRRFLHIIHDESIRMTRLLDGILDLSLLEGEKTAWTLAPVDPELALEKAVGVCQGLASDGTLLLLNGARPGPTGSNAGMVRVNGDSDRLHQVFINLISNAIKYNTSDKPFVRVTSLVENGWYQVLVEDNGPGIRKDEREKIFQKFSRGWEHTQSGTQGAGLGLAISRQIMRRLGGTLELMPDTGLGACFRIRLPTV